MIEQSIYESLITCPPITAITGQNIFPVVMEQNVTSPAVVYRISRTVESPSLDTGGMERLRFVFECWSGAASDPTGTYLQAATLRAALVSAFHGYQSPDFTSFLVNQEDGYSSDLRKYVCNAEFDVLTTNI